MPEDTTKSPAGVAPPTARLLERGTRQFIVAPRRGNQAASAGFRSMSAGAMRAALAQVPGFEVVRVLRPRRTGSPLALGPDEATEVYVARIDPDRGELIAHTLSPQFLVEEDGRLEAGTPALASSFAPGLLSTWSTMASIESRPIRFRIVGEGDKPLGNVGVSLCGEGFPQEGRTDKRGEVTLPLWALAGQRARSLLVSSPIGYWDHFLGEPDLVESDVNTVRLRPIEDTIAGFPSHYRYGWGQLQMGLDRVPETLTGKGVKIAIVDSGADTSHPLLRHLRAGRDFTNGADPESWRRDEIGHGSHAAGIIAARDESGRMLRGFAPDADIHVLKVAPGTRFSTLVEALDYCVELEIDVVNVNLGSRRWSAVVEQKLEEAALSGIACIVAAGSSGGPVQYPASSPYTLAVGALGRLNEYPDATWDATTVIPNLVAADGLFSPSFTSIGPEIGVVAPGVAVVSTVPGGFEPRSGTSVAAPHVTGLAALLLAHHPAFQGPLAGRSQHRVAALFTMIRWMCVPYAFGAERAGAGLPRLHGLEHLLQQVGRAAPDAHAGAYSAGPTTAGPAYAASAGTMPAAAMPVGTMVDPAQVASLYVQAPLVAQAWPVQALLESLRRQYLGS